jgi:hypothetical protein
MLELKASYAANFHDGNTRKIRLQTLWSAGIPARNEHGVRSRLKRLDSGLWSARIFAAILRGLCGKVLRYFAFFCDFA